MKEDPEYLRNRSRSIHRSYRRNRRGTNIFLSLWAIFFLGRFALSLIDLVGGFGWGYTWTDAWSSLGFAGFAGALWLFMALIQSILLAYVRQTYGPEPLD